MTDLENAMHKIRWGANQPSWSTDLTSAECAALLSVIPTERIEVTTIEEIDGVNPEANT